MSSLKELINIKIDFELDIYEKVLEKLQSDGILFVLDDKENENNTFEKIKLNQKLTFEDTFGDKGLFFFMAYKKLNLRGNLFQPFYSEIFYLKDIVTCEKKSENKYLIRLIEKSETRKKNEIIFYDSRSFLEDCLSDLWTSLKIMLIEDRLMSQDDVRLLKCLNILENSNPNYGYFKKERKEIKIKCKDSIQKIIDEKKHFELNSIQEYKDLSNGYLNQFEYWQNKYNWNIKFWMNKEISSKEFMENWERLY